MTRNVAASVRQRLLNKARAEGRPFIELLQYFALERFLYRLGRSSYSNRFVLKGALMFGVWQEPFSRPTRDVDLLGHVEHTVERVTTVMRAICQQPYRKTMDCASMQTALPANASLRPPVTKACV